VSPADSSAALMTNLPAVAPSTYAGISPFPARARSKSERPEGISRKTEAESERHGVYADGSSVVTAQGEEFSVAGSSSVIGASNSLSHVSPSAAGSPGLYGRRQSVVSVAPSYHTVEFNRS
jgi:hypothetical protein